MTNSSLVTKIFLLCCSWWILAFLGFSSDSVSIILASIALGLAISFWSAFNLQRSIKSLTQIRWDQSKPLSTQNIRQRELLELANKFNAIFGELNAKIGTLSLEHSEHMAIFNSMNEGIIAIDERSRVKYANPAATRILELDGENYSGKTIEECVRNPEILLHLESAVKNETSLSQEIPLYDSKERWLHIQSSPLKKNERSQGTIAVFSDISHIKKLENLRQEFVANVSHELRTPLTSIHGFAETLLKNPNLSHEQSRQFLDIICSQSRRLGALIDDLLSLSRIESAEENQNLELISIPLRSVAEAAVKLCNSERIKIVEKQNPRIPVNIALLEQACINLIENALRYGGESPIEVVIDAENGFAKISIRDYGPGIASEHLPRLFERFYRADRARSQKVGGTGLGLAIVKHIALAHQGRVEVQSELKKGSTFTLFLPLTQTAQV
ncbi:MAG: hypothetical protein A4S09_16820 [Proteobacteria bacterium SG_bin7]|nr:MAG: hypothetical protein A4S09_16820 [Proteobacteria bacterium SG_bin7]